jgi:hypothetical protein
MKIPTLKTLFSPSSHHDPQEEILGLVSLSAAPHAEGFGLLSPAPQAEGLGSLSPAPHDEGAGLASPSFDPHDEPHDEESIFTDAEAM